MTQQNNPPSARLATPFSSASRHGGAQQPQSPPQQPAAPPPNQPPPPPPKPSGLTSRFGPTKVKWRIMPTQPFLVRFDLVGLGDPFHRLMGKSLNLEMGDIKNVIKRFEAGGAEIESLAATLDAHWSDYKLRGAVALYRWNPEVRAVLQGQIPGDSDDEEAQSEVYDDDRCPMPVILRALDLWFVLNVLGRARANILLPNAPLALEGPYLSQSLYCDDPRLAAIAQATGVIEEPLK